MFRNDERMSRQDGIINRDLAESVVFIVGCGMLGGWTAHAAARFASHVVVMDGDSVEAVNSGNQPYTIANVGVNKAEATEENLDGFPVTAMPGWFDETLTKDDIMRVTRLPDIEHRKLVVVSGVDSFVFREQIARWAQREGAAVFVDTRAMTEVAVTCVVPPHMIDQYLSEEIYDDADTPDVQCGMNGTAYVGQFVASQVGAYLNAFFIGLPVPFVQVVNLQLHDVTRRVMTTEAPVTEEVMLPV